MVKNDILVRFLSFFVLLKNDRKSVANNLKRMFIKYQYLLLMLIISIGILMIVRVFSSKSIETFDTLDNFEYDTDIQEPTPVNFLNDPIREEAEFVAKVLYGTALDNSSKGKELVVWCIINRVESENYPNTIKEVCQQKDQWMGYSDNNPIMQELYDIAYTALSKWHENSYRTISPDYIFMSWSPTSIVLRTEFKDSKTCKYLYE